MRVLFLSMLVCQIAFAQTDAETYREITALIGKYAEAREKSDTALLKQILLPEVDQLVSTGEWRIGISAAVDGMLQSTTHAPGTRTLAVDKLKLLTATSAIVDCRYEIKGNNSKREMWSTFVVVKHQNSWRISAIRNMLPAK